MKKSRFYGMATIFSLCLALATNSLAALKVPSQISGGGASSSSGTGSHADRAHADEIADPHLQSWVVDLRASLQNPDKLLTLGKSLKRFAKAKPENVAELLELIGLWSAHLESHLIF